MKVLERIHELTLRKEILGKEQPIEIPVEKEPIKLSSSTLDDFAKKIEAILKQNDMQYQMEYSFSDLLADGSHIPLRFDFAVFDDDGNIDFLIEFQGEQHTQPSNGFFSDELVKHDKMKKEYCKKNNIPLLCIYYQRGQDVIWKDLELE